MITLSDESVKRPRDLIIAAGWVMCATAMLTFLAKIIFNFKSYRQVIVEFLLTLVSILVIGGLMYIYVVHRSVTSIRNVNHLDRALSQIRRIRRWKFLRETARFIHCPANQDDLWRRVISALAPEVDAVILDCHGELTSNIEWELRQLLEYCRPAKVIVAISADAAILAHTPQLPDVDFTLKTLLGSAKESVGIITYPQRVPLIVLTAKYEAIIRPAQRIIGVAALTPKQ